ncbi:uncharacterized protein EDB93DRAFT_1100361 [Suillus bovinus]|uniref:uncharacterized protein n=1 Tax=Suillus bovinus TaxID=48563 RepID=UPI001B87DA03|nr:uncharacterized protein EDB93DRAFT_1100361 [Suillus bovinus]KAG2158729.1 hypothetical protein EDB93DRAFT_1100361 [Suillus bovinus]
MPPSSTISLADLEQALRETQLELQELKDVNKELTEENKILKANQPKRKKKGQNASEEHMAFDEEIRLCGRKYGACYEMFAPDRQLLQCPNPAFAPPLNESSRYETQASAESALLAELFSLLPSHIHPLVADNHFADVFEDAMNSSRASKIKKLCSKAGLIFGLSEQYFADIAYDRASVPEIQGLLGTSTSQRMPKPFPPILFPNLIEDPSLKMVFGNWEPFGKAIRILLWGENGLTALRAGGPPRNGNRWEVTSLTPGLLAWVGVVVVFLLSADKEFRYSSKGEMTKIQYSYMFTSYKKILVKNWNTEYTRDIVKKLNNYVFSRDEEDFTAAMDRALAGVTEEDIMDETVADAEANRERPRPSSPLTSEPNDEDEVSNIVTAPAAVRGRRGGRAARCVVSNTSTRTTRNARTTT